MGRETTEGGKSTPRWTTKAGAVSQSVGWGTQNSPFVRPPVRPSTMQQAAVARAQPTCAAHLPCTRHRQRRRAADRPTVQPTAAAGWQRLKSQPPKLLPPPPPPPSGALYHRRFHNLPLSLLERGREEKGEGPKAPSPCRWPTKRARSELRPTPLAGWREGGREGCTPSSCVMGALARSLPRSLAYTELMMGRSERRGRSKERKRIARAAQEASGAVVMFNKSTTFQTYMYPNNIFEGKDV